MRDAFAFLSTSTAPGLRSDLSKSKETSLPRVSRARLLLVVTAPTGQNPAGAGPAGGKNDLGMAGAAVVVVAPQPIARGATKEAIPSAKRGLVFMGDWERGYTETLHRQELVRVTTYRFTNDDSELWRARVCDARQ